MQTISFTTIAVIFRGTKFGHFMIFSPRRTSAKFTQNVYNIAAALKRLRERERERERESEADIDCHSIIGRRVSSVLLLIYLVLHTFLA